MRVCPFKGPLMQGKSCGLKKRGLVLDIRCSVCLGRCYKTLSCRVIARILSGISWTLDRIGKKIRFGFYAAILYGLRCTLHGFCASHGTWSCIAVLDESLLISIYTRPSGVSDPVIFRTLSHHRIGRSHTFVPRAGR